MRSARVTPRRLRSLVTLAVGGVLVSLLPACGGGGGGGGGGGPTSPGPSVTFSPSGTTGPEALILRESPDSTPSRLVLELVAQDVTRVYGLSFDLQYPASVLSFEAAVEEGFLGADGADTSLQVAEQPAGNLVIGLTRLGRVQGISGSGVLLSLELRAVGNGSGALRFDANEAFDSEGDPIPSIRWGAGTVQVVL